MKNIYIIVLCLGALFFSGCQSLPKNFSYRYDGNNTGLENRIDINGYYVSQHGCDSAFFSMYMFYPDGLFTIATTSSISPELVGCFEKGGTSSICQYPLWGVYRIDGDTIKTQVIRSEGNGCVIFRDYKILTDGNVVNISDYVEARYTNLGYMQNYPSFAQNACPVPAKFHPLQSKRDVSECPFLNRITLKSSLKEK